MVCKFLIEGGFGTPFKRRQQTTFKKNAQYYKSAIIASQLNGRGRPRENPVHAAFFIQ